MICQTDRKVAGEVQLHVDNNKNTTRNLLCYDGKRSLMKNTTDQTERKVLLLQFHFCLIERFLNPKGNSQPLSMTPFCHRVSFSSRARCSVSSPQSRSLFPYSLCSPICCGRRSSTACSVCVCLRTNGFSLHCTCHYSCLCV